MRLIPNSKEEDKLVEELQELRRLKGLSCSALARKVEKRKKQQIYLGRAFARLESGEGECEGTIYLKFCRGIERAPWYPLMSRDERYECRSMISSFRPAHERMEFRAIAETIMRARGYHLNWFGTERGLGWHTLARQLKKEWGNFRMKRNKVHDRGVWIGRLRGLFDIAKVLRVEPWVFYMTLNELEEVERYLEIETCES